MHNFTQIKSVIFLQNQGMWIANKELHAMSLWGDKSVYSFWVVLLPTFFFKSVYNHVRISIDPFKCCSLPCGCDKKEEWNVSTYGLGSFSPWDKFSDSTTYADDNIHLMGIDWVFAQCCLFLGVTRVAFCAHKKWGQDYTLEFIKFFYSNKD